MCHQFHLRGGPGVRADGGRGPERAAAAGGLGGGRRSVLPGGVHLQHVCDEPGALPDVPRCEKSRAAEPSAADCVHFFTGRQHLPKAVCLKDVLHLSSKHLKSFFSILMSFQSHYSVKKGVAFLGIGTDNVITVKVDDG